MAPHCPYLEKRASGKRADTARAHEGAKGKLDADSCQPRNILPSFRGTNPRAAKETLPFPRGHDFLRLLSTSLATNRGGTTSHSLDAVACVCGIRDLDGPLGPGIG